MAGAVGVRGELRVTAFGDDPLSLLSRVLRGPDGAPTLELTSGRLAKGGLVARAKGVADRTAAEALRGLRLFVRRDELPAAGDEEYYLADLIGLEARSPEGERLGRVRSVADFGAGDLLEIAPESGSATWWCPFTRDAVPEVRLDAGWVTVVRPPETGD